MRGHYYVIIMTARARKAKAQSEERRAYGDKRPQWSHSLKKKISKAYPGAWRPPTRVARGRLSPTSRAARARGAAPCGPAPPARRPAGPPTCSRGSRSGSPAKGKGGSTGTQVLQRCRVWGETQHPLFLRTREEGGKAPPPLASHLDRDVARARHLGVHLHVAELILRGPRVGGEEEKEKGSRSGGTSPPSRKHA